MITPEYNGQLALFNLAIWLVLILKYNKVFSFENKPNEINNNYIWPTVLLALYGIFAFAEADTYHLEEGYEYMYKTNDIIQVEPFYFWLIHYLPHNYYLWRTVVWGLSSIIILITAHKLKLDTNTFGFFCALNFLPQFAQTRGTLGFSILMLALVLISQSKKKFGFIIGLLLVVSTYFLHKSIPVFLLFIPIAILLPLRKNIFILSIFLFPFLYKTISFASEYVLELSYISEMTLEKGLSYLSRESTVDEYSIVGNLFNLLQYSSIFCLYYVMLNFYTSKSKDLNKSASFLFKYGFVSTYVAFLFWGQDMSDFLHTRTLHFAVFPTLFSAVYCFQNKKRFRLDQFTMILLGLSAFKEIAYHIYKWW